MKFSKRTVAVAVAVFTISGGGAAYAILSTTGSGGGTAATIATPDPIVFAVTPASAIKPGTPVDLALTVPGGNSNHFKVTVTPVVTLTGATGAAGFDCTGQISITRPAGVVDVSAAGVITPGYTTAQVTWNEDTAENRCLNAALTFAVA